MSMAKFLAILLSILSLHKLKSTVTSTDIAKPSNIEEQDAVVAAELVAFVDFFFLNFLYLIHVILENERK